MIADVCSRACSLILFSFPHESPQTDGHMKENKYAPNNSINKIPEMHLKKRRQKKKKERNKNMKGKKDGKLIKEVK